MRRPLLVLLAAGMHRRRAGLPLRKLHGTPPRKTGFRRRRASTRWRGKPLRYLIGNGPLRGPGRDDEADRGVLQHAATGQKRGISIAYCNLFDELNTGRYGPYLHTSDTAGAVTTKARSTRVGRAGRRTCASSSSGAGSRASSTSKLDNPDAYSVEDVIGAIELAAGYGPQGDRQRTPGLLEDIARKDGRQRPDAATSYVAHPNVHGVIVERGRGRCRRDGSSPPVRPGKPTLPGLVRCLLVMGRAWGPARVASTAKNYRKHGRDLFEPRRIRQTRSTSFRRPEPGFSHHQQQCRSAGPSPQTRFCPTCGDSSAISTSARFQQP